MKKDFILPCHGLFELLNVYKTTTPHSVSRTTKKQGVGLLGECVTVLMPVSANIEFYFLARFETDFTSGFHSAIYTTVGKQCLVFKVQLQSSFQSEIT